MQNLTIPVSHSTAYFWNETPPERQAEIIRMFSSIVVKNASEPMTPARFAQILDEMSTKAIANGLTEEILEEILNER